MRRPLNPFAPAHPISPSQFVGRPGEIAELEAALQHAKSGRARHFLMTGSRGVGKTSLLDYIRRRSLLNEENSDFNFIVIDFSVNRNTTRLDLARAIKSELDDALSSYSPFRDVLARSWSFIQRIEAAGFSIRGDDRVLENHRDLYVELANSLSEIVLKLCGSQEEGFLPGLEFDGVLVLIDEVDQASAELDVGSFLKYLLERLNRRGCSRVVIGLAGLPSAIDVLVNSHPSSLRVFDELRLGNLKSEEVDELLAEAELDVMSGGYESFHFTKEAKETIFDFSDGHPHFVHQFGYCAFERACGAEEGDGNFIVDRSHVIQGAFEPRGALELIGDVYFRKPFDEVATNDASLEVLDFLSEVPRQSFSVAEIKFSSVFDAETQRQAVESLIAAGLIIDIDDIGRYQLRHSCFGFWLKARRPQSAV